jgi:predicted DsbA family dithiol-disulfide isomerase
MAGSVIAIDVVSDVICPWCFLGKRRLDRALESLPEGTAEIRWRPFLLDASIPREGLDRQDYLRRKFGEARLATLHDPLIAAGKADGVPYRFDRIARTPNTLDAHRLLRWAAAAGRQHAMAERLFLAYWNEGKDVGDRAVLRSFADEVSVDGADRLDSDADLEAVRAEIDAAAAMGIASVPTFIVGNRYAVIGAQPAEVLKSAITRALFDARSAAG